MSQAQESTPRQWISHFQIVLPDVARRRVLLLAADEGWRLPFLAVEGGIWVGNSHRILAALRERLGLGGDYTVLRYLWMELNEEERWDRVVLVLELHEEPSAPPLGGEWVARERLADLPLADEFLRTLLLAYLEEEKSGEVVPLRAPWARPGWFVEAAGWMGATLSGLGRPPTGAVQQFKNLGISSLLRVPTESGLVYAKATAKLPLFVNEARLMERLAQRFPGQIPGPLAIEAEKGWMLLDDFGPDLGTSQAGVEEIGRALGQYAGLQMASADLIDDLLALGCLDRRLPVLAGQIDLLIDHPLTARHARAADIARLRLLAPQLKAHCAELADYHLPDTLVHGDLHRGNIARRGEAFLFYDWSDSCISHPFLDMITPYFFLDDPEEAVRVRDGYLAQWSGWESEERLYAAWRLAKPLAALHQAVSYLHILLGQEEVVHQEMADGLRGFVGHTVKALAEREDEDQ